MRPNFEVNDLMDTSDKPGTNEVRLDIKDEPEEMTHRRAQGVSE